MTRFRPAFRGARSGLVECSFYVEINGDEVELTARGFHVPDEPQTYWDPGCPASMEDVELVNARGVPVPATKEMLDSAEEALWEALEGRDDCDEYDLEA
jgi:hypothetical protein